MRWRRLPWPRRRQSDLTSALQSVDKIDDPGMRVRALAGPLFDGAGIAWIRDSAGDKKGAGLALNKAISIVSTMPQSEEKDYATASLAIARARLGSRLGTGQRAGRAGQGAQGRASPKSCPRRDCRDPGRKWRLGCCLTNGERRCRSGGSRLVLSARSVTLQSKAGKRDAALETLQKALDANSKSTTGSKTTASPLVWPGPVTSRPRWGSSTRWPLCRDQSPKPDLARRSRRDRGSGRRLSRGPAQSPE